MMIQCCFSFSLVYSEHVMINIYINIEKLKIKTTKETNTINLIYMPEKEREEVHTY